MLTTQVNSDQARGLIPTSKDGFLDTATSPMTCTPTVTVRITVRVLSTIAKTKNKKGAESPLLAIAV